MGIDMKPVLPLLLVFKEVKVDIRFAIILSRDN